MKSIHRKISMLMLLAALGCGDDSSGDSQGKGGGSLAEGESYFSLDITGDDLEAQLHFEGKTDKIGLYVSDDIRALASNEIGIGSTPSGFHLGLMTLGIRLKAPGTVDENGFDINLVVEGFNNEHGTTAYSLREKDGKSSLTVTSVDDSHAKGHFEFDASPTQGKSTHLVYHVKGSFEFRD